MKLIAGLGNPGKRYAKTRHNVGFRVVEELATRHRTNFKRKLFYRSNETRHKFLGEDIILIEPLTFMNLSGGCVLHYINKLKLPLDDMLVVSDDFNLALGSIRLRASGSSGGHNGLESVIKILKTDSFPRVRVGVKGVRTEGDLAEYVLSGFGRDESADIDEAVRKAADACECWIRDGIGKAMSVYNG